MRGKKGFCSKHDNALFEESSQDTTKNDNSISTPKFNQPCIFEMKEKETFEGS